jgi:hypothetical protein
MSIVSNPEEVVKPDRPTAKVVENIAKGAGVRLSGDSVASDINANLDYLATFYAATREKKGGITSAEICKGRILWLWRHLNKFAPKIQTTAEPGGLHLIEKWVADGYDLDQTFEWLLKNMIEHVKSGGPNIESLECFLPKAEPPPTTAPLPSADHSAPLGHTAGFFSIDLGAFRRAAAGGLNPAVAHLILARGTGRDNRTTQWSVHAIEQRTGISRPNATKAVEDLLERGVWKTTRKGKHPIYKAVHAPGSSALPVWLPNSLIDGAAGEVPPIELVRQTRSLPALRLLIELYAVQFLPNYGGVPRDVLKGVFDRERIGEQGPFVVWGFRPRNISAGHSDLARQFWTGKIEKRENGREQDTGWEATFWPAVHALVDLGLVERVGMLLEGDDDDAEIIHPYAIRGGEPTERELALAAQNAARVMVTEGQMNWALEQGYRHLVPVRKHIAKATMVDVFRLKYRPHTKATAAWYAMMQGTTADHIGRYRAMTKERSVKAA